MNKKMIMISSKGNDSAETLRLSTDFLDILVEIIADLEEGVDGNATGGCGEQAAEAGSDAESRTLCQILKRQSARSVH